MSSHLDEQSSRRHTMELQLWVRAVNHPTDTNHNFVRMSQALAQQLHDLALDSFDDVEPLVFAQIHCHLAWIPNRTTCRKSIDFLLYSQYLYCICIRRKCSRFQSVGQASKSLASCTRLWWHNASRIYLSSILFFNKGEKIYIGMHEWWSFNWFTVSTPRHCLGSSFVFSTSTVRSWSYSGMCMETYTLVVRGLYLHSGCGYSFIHFMSQSISIS